MININLIRQEYKLKDLTVIRLKFIIRFNVKCIQQKKKSEKKIYIVGIGLVLDFIRISVYYLHIYFFALFQNCKF